MEVDDNTGFYHVLEPWLRAQDTKYDPYLTASSFGWCPRSTFYKIKKVEQTTPRSVYDMLVLYMGTMIHKMLEDASRAHDPEAILEKKLYSKKLGFGGTPDNLRKVNGKWILTDHKSQKLGAFKRVKNMSDEKIMREQWPHHGKQLTAQKMLIREELGIEVDKCQIAYWEKENLLYRLCSFSPTKEDEASIQREADDFNRYLNSNTIPPCTCDGWKKDGCVYGDVGTRDIKTFKDVSGKEYEKEVNTECCMQELAAEMN